jgi:hypothetical protein
VESLRGPERRPQGPAAASDEAISASPKAGSRSTATSCRRRRSEPRSRRSRRSRGHHRTPGARACGSAASAPGRRSRALFGSRHALAHDVGQRWAGLDHEADVRAPERVRRNAWQRRSVPRRAQLAGPRTSDQARGARCSSTDNVTGTAYRQPTGNAAGPGAHGSLVRCRSKSSAKRRKHLLVGQRRD